MVADATSGNRKRIGPVLSEALQSTWYSEDERTVKRRKGVSRMEREQRRVVTKINQIRTKTDCTQEMIVDIEETLYQKQTGGKIQTSIKLIYGQTEPREYYTENIIGWRRRVSVQWDDDSESFVYVDEHIKEEDHILVYMTTKEFNNLCTDMKSLQAHVQSMKHEFPTYRIIYMIEGFRQSSQHLESIVWLQVVERCCVLFVPSVVKMTEWIATLTENIAIVPYRYV
jgi:ERCC4 domain